MGKKRGLPQWTGLTGSSARRLAAAASKKAAGESEGAFLRRVLPEICRATSWRNQAYNAPQNDKYSTASYPEMLQQAEFFESWIQGFRRRRLAGDWPAERQRDGPRARRARGAHSAACSLAPWPKTLRAACRKFHSTMSRTRMARPAYRMTGNSHRLAS